MEEYLYPLIVCEEEGKIVFFNSAAQAAFGGEELLGRPLPEDWMQADQDVEIDTADSGRIPFRLLWQQILWDGNVAWYLVAVPSSGPETAPAAEQAAQIRSELEEAQPSSGAELEELRRQLAQAEEERQSLREELQRAEIESSVEIDQLRERLEQSQEDAQQAQELQERLSRVSEAAQEAEQLRVQLEQSAEMAAVEVEKRRAAEGERERLEAKLRDLHQRSLSKLEAARTALENERGERNALSERLARLKQETDLLRAQLEERSMEVEAVQARSGEHFEQLKAELLRKTESLTSREGELSDKSRALTEAEERMASLAEELATKEREVAAAEERADRFRREYEDLERELFQAQEQREILSAKLRTAESRLERYQRLMDREPNEFERQSPEAEVEKLRQRVEELEVELAATAASSSDFGRSSELAAEIAQLRAQVVDRDSRLSELEAKLQRPVLDDSDPPSGAGQHELDEARALIAELRFHRELEYQELQGSLRALQERYAGLKVNGVADDSAELEELSNQLVAVQAELQDTENRLTHALHQLELKTEVAQSVPLLRERVQLLEEKLARASEAGSPDPALLARVRELEQEIERARLEASPQELQLARRRISELEAQMAAGSPGGGETDLQKHNAYLESELQRAREQLSELSLELRRTQEGDRETKKLAYADQLTGLPNLNLTGQYLQVCFERSGRGEGALALILIDLDHFRRVNDALGQKAGDELLKQVGARLQRSVTEKDTAIARRGEDEFMVVAFMDGARVDGEALMARVRGIAHNLLNELAKPFEVLDQKVQVTASLGVALYPGPAGSRLELLEQSEHAMYKAKESGRARVSFYTEDMHNTRLRRNYLEQELKQGISQGQFGLVYQPIYELSSSKVVGVEALLRWNHPTRGFLEPADFLEAAEDTGLIVPIGDMVLQEALTIAKQKFMKRKFLSLNLSFRQLIDSGFSARFMKHLQVAGVPPHEVIVEISERTARIDPGRIKNTLAHLSHWGVGIALDDFGTGSSELNQLTDLNLRVLKIDGQLIRKIPDDRAATKLCHAITKMSTALEIPVLAEGIETREQLSQVAAIGCQYAQGLILNAPMSVNQLIQVL